MRRSVVAGLVVVISVLFLVGTASAIEKRTVPWPSLSEDFRNALRELDSLSIEGRPHGFDWEEFKSQLQNGLEDMRRIGSDELHKVMEVFGHLYQDTKTEITQRMQKNVQREKHNVDILEEWWQKLWAKLQQGMSKASSAGKKEMDVIKDRLQTLVHNAQQLSSGPKWEKLVSTVSKELEVTERFWANQIQRVEDTVKALLHKAKGQGPHQPHRVLMKCCGKDMTFQEFIDSFDPNHILAMPEDEHYNDESIEEYYEGWAEWANHLNLPCPDGADCAHPKWEDVVMYDEQKEHTKKDEL